MPLEKGHGKEVLLRNIAALVGEGKEGGEPSGMAEDRGDVDVNGFVEFPDTIISLPGVFQYRGKTILSDPDVPRELVDPGKVYRVFRSPDELADPQAIESFKSLPWIDEHKFLGPKESGLTPAEENPPLGVLGEKIHFRDGALYGNPKAFAGTLIDLIDGGKNQLSLAYRCKYKHAPGVYDGQSYDFVQHTIRGNHLALVSRGRMGDRAAISMDGEDVEMDEDKVREICRQLIMEMGLGKAQDSAVEPPKPEPDKDDKTKTGNAMDADDVACIVAAHEHAARRRVALIAAATPFTGSGFAQDGWDLAKVGEYLCDKHKIGAHKGESAVVAAEAWVSGRQAAAASAPRVVQRAGIAQDSAEAAPLGDMMSRAGARA
ncbi:MAG: DUF2213 domain-containing protein [Limnohabitans sp.]